MGRALQRKLLSRSQHLHTDTNMEAQANEALRELHHRAIAIGLSPLDIAQVEENIRCYGPNAATRLIIIEQYYSYYRGMTKLYFNLMHSN